MKKAKIVFIPLLLLNLFCFAQTKPGRLLASLFDNFPIDSSLKFIANYYKSKNGSANPNIYDSTKTDYSSELYNWLVFDYKPTSIHSECYYGGIYPLGDTTPKETLISLLTVFYHDTASHSANKQYDRLLDEFGKIYRHSRKIYLESPEGREGEMVKFYVDSLLKMPVLTIELNYETETVFGEGSTLAIAYIRPYPNSENK